MKKNAIYYVNVFEGEITSITRDEYEVRHHHPVSSRSIAFREFPEIAISAHKAALAAIFGKIDKA